VGCLGFKKKPCRKLKWFRGERGGKTTAVPSVRDEKKGQETCRVKEEARSSVPLNSNKIPLTGSTNKPFPENSITQKDGERHGDRLAT